ncbi:unnamed protein product, partial [Allacma fusca]
MFLYINYGQWSTGCGFVHSRGIDGAGRGSGGGGDGRLKYELDVQALMKLGETLVVVQVEATAFETLV